MFDTKGWTNSIVTAFSEQAKATFFDQLRKAVIYHDTVDTVIY